MGESENTLRKYIEWRPFIAPVCKEVRSHYSHSYNKKRANKWKITDGSQIVSACNAGDHDSIPGSGRSTVKGIGYPLQYSWASLVAQLVKNPPVMWETWVWSLGRSPGEWNGYPFQYSGLEDSTESLWGHKESDMTERLSLPLRLFREMRLRSKPPAWVLERHENSKELEARSPYREKKPLESQTGRNI